MITTHPKFDRKATKPPPYFDRLRNKGWWRMWDYMQGYQRYGIHGWYSQAFGSVKRFIEGPRRVFLDAGCGDSPDALIAVRDEKFGKAYKVDLFPPSNRYSVNMVGKNFATLEKKLGVEFIQNDICEKLPLEDNSVDLISCNAMIDLIPEDDRILFYKEAYRLLRPGGLLSVSIVHLANGHGTDDLREWNCCIMPGWGVGFDLVEKTQSLFIVKKPERTNQ